MNIFTRIVAVLRPVCRKFYRGGMLSVLPAVVMSLMLPLIHSCEDVYADGPNPDDLPDVHKDKAIIRICFEEVEYEKTKASNLHLPDTCDFLLSIKDSKGKSVYSGKFGNCPESIFVDAGTYDIDVLSAEFSKPAFDAPQFGDKQCVVLKKGETAKVVLTCRQMNCGISLKLSSDFLSSYPDAVMYVSSSAGRLMYAYKEKRIAYFPPGKISVVMSQGLSDKVLTSPVLKAGEIMVLTLSAPGSSSSATKSSITVKVDTSRTWLKESYNMGGGASSGGGTAGSAMSVAKARECAGAEDVWVYGYIVGCFKSVNSIAVTEPFASATNIIIAGRTTYSSKESCMSVELKKGDIRDDLNLSDNPELLGEKVRLCGDIVDSYFGIPGLKNVTGYELD